MIELYMAYVKERLGFESIIEEGKAFVIFKTEGPEIYIQDIYVAPEYRKHGIMEEMERRVEAIAIARGCTFATGTVQPSAANSEASLEYCFKRGYKILEVHPNVIILRKELIKE